MPKYTMSQLNSYRQLMAVKAPPTSLVNSVKQLRTKVLMSVMGLSLLNQYTAFIDLSEYNLPSQVNFDTLKDNGICAVVIRASSGMDYKDPLVETFFAMARKAGMMIGLYHWIDSTDDLAKQELFFVSIVDKLKPDFLTLDVEQWWSNWDLWDQALVGKLSWDKVPHILGKKVSDDARNMRDWLVARYPKIKVLIYTGTWLTVAPYIPELNTWLGTAYTWIAVYLKVAIPSAWVSFWSFIHGLGNPTLPTSVKTETAWQLSSDFIILNTWERKDLSRFHGTLADMQAFFGVSVTPGPDPAPDYDRYTVIPSWLTVHNGPGTIFKAVAYLEGKGEGVTTIVTEYRETILADGEEWIQINPIDQTAQLWVNEGQLAPI